VLRESTARHSAGPASPPPGTELVNAARSGDPRAQAALFGQYLPLIYNIVGRGLHGHPDVDDVVQDTMLSAIRALPQLREPERFRSWIVAIAIRQMHDRGRRNKTALVHQQPLTEVSDVVDPEGDFAERALDRQTLSRAGGDLTEASRWIGADHRRTLSLWWQETAGYLTRAEVAEALNLSPAHTAVRIQRMKAKLEPALDVLAAWRATPRCAELDALGAGAADPAAGRLLTRLSRHVDGCRRCQAATDARRSIDELPIRLGALPVPVGLTALIPSLLRQHTASYGALHSLLHLPGRVLGGGLHRMSVKSAAVVAAATATAAGFAIYVSPLTHHRSVPAARNPVSGATQPSGTDTADTSPSSTSASRTTSPTSYSGVASADYYVATDGSDANPGTLAEPFASLARALSAVKPGQTIALRGGTYEPPSTIVLAGSGTTGHQITISNYRDEHPVLSGSRLPSADWLIAQSGGYVTVQGVEIADAPGAAYVCQSCHDDVFTRLSVHGNGNVGLQLRGAGTHDDLVLDSDFFDNHESGPSGGYADGLAVMDGSGTGNRIEACRIYDNSGDGVDLSGFADAVAVDHSWSFGNGVNRWHMKAFSSGGSGFKLGGNAGLRAAPVVTASAAWDNAGFGFTETGGSGAAQLTGDTAFRNGAAGFAFVHSAAALRDDLALANHPDAWLGSQARHSGDSWDQSGWTSADLRITDEASTTDARGAEGRLPATSFLGNAGDSAIGAPMN
jgi:RNA polymerase sigma factor (sigma-70 family)